MIEFFSGGLGEGALFEGAIEGGDPGGAEDQNNGGDGSPGPDLALAIGGREAEGDDVVGIGEPELTCDTGGGGVDETGDDQIVVGIEVGEWAFGA